MVRIPNPYPYLDAYTLDNAEFFFGREKGVGRLAELIEGHRHTLLFGPPSAGKTSLIQAGLTAYYQEQGIAVCTVWGCGHPSQACVVRLAHSPSGRKTSTPTPLSKLLPQHIDPDRTAVLVFDQLDWLFGQVPALINQQFAADLAPILHDYPALKVVWVLRERNLYCLDLFSETFPDIMNARFHIGHLTPQQAREAIVGPAEKAGYRYEEALLTTLLRDLGPDRVVAPRLQVVCRALHQCLSEDKATLTLSAYDDLGGARAILIGHLDDLLTELPDEEDRDLARALLKEMVELDDPSYVWKLRVPQSRDLRRLSGDNPARLNNLLAFWQAQGIVHQPSEEREYSLTSPFLIHQVSEWAQEDKWATKDIRDVLRSSLIEHWRTGKLLEKPGLGRLWQNRTRMRFSDEELTLILRSALARGYQWRFWVERAAGAGISIWPIVREALESQDPHSRSSAVTALGDLTGTEAVALLQTALSDPYPNVRGLAREALARSSIPQALEVLRKHPPLDVVLIPAGPFWMGSDQGSDEGPSRQVYVDAFYIDRYPVTNTEYAKFVQDTGHPPPEHWGPHDGTYPPGRGDYPVAYVCWFDARDYVTWARKRLPTEAEWEKAARGTDGRLYPWGNQFNSDHCNTDESEFLDTTPVNAFSPGGDSPYGVADMAGNVWEWVTDWYDREYYRYAPDRNPRGPEIGKTKVLRGGSWDFSANEARCSTRNHEYPGPRHGLIGFRCAADVLPDES